MTYLQKEGRELTVSWADRHDTARMVKSTITWLDLVEKLRQVKITEDTADEFASLPKGQQTKIKGGAGYVIPGRFKNNYRNAANVIYRDVLVLDADFTTSRFPSEAGVVWGTECVIHSTHSHTPDNPRFRAFLPLTRSVSPEEYRVIAETMMKELDWKQFDEGSPQPERAMFLPSVPSDVDYVFEHFEGEWLDPDEILAEAGVPSPGGVVDMKGDPVDSNDLTALANAKQVSGKSIEELREIIFQIEPGTKRDPWLAVLMALHFETQGSQEGLDLADEWSAGAPNYEGRQDVEARWNSFSLDDSRKKVTLGTLIERSRKKKTKSKTVPAGLIALADYQEIVRPVDWRIESYMEDDATGGIFGASDTFKSFFAIDQAMHIAAGIPWHGKAVKQGPGIYIAGEGHNGLGRRFLAWCHDKGLDPADVPWFATKAPVAFDDEDSVEAIIEVIEAAVGDEKPGIVIIDTLARNFGDGDENSTGDMSRFVNHVDLMVRARFNCTVLVVHHTGLSDGNRGRGSSALKAGLDMEFKVEAIDHAEKLSRITCTKMKNAERPDVFAIKGRTVEFTTSGGFTTDSLVFDYVEDGFEPVQEIEEAADKLIGKQKDLYGVLKALGRCSRDDMRASFGEKYPDLSRRAVLRLLGELKSKGIVEEGNGEVYLALFN